MREQPLEGMTIVVTRPRSQAPALARPLEEAGASVVVAPMIEFRPCDDTPQIQGALARLPEYDALLFTSANAVTFFQRALQRWGESLDPAMEIYAIGPATARRVEDCGWKPMPLPAAYRAEGVAEAILSRRRGGRLLLPRAAQAREILPERLTEGGIEVTILPIYETRAAREGKEILHPLLWQGRLDLLTFTSGSAVTSLLEAFRNPPDPQALTALWQTPAACLGPVTAQIARRNGFHVSVEPGEATIPALVAAIVETHRKKR
ncbi:MAG: uroporphyrinogen-III synthase [Deltaproteobacteria bacterium]|nr:MAG: uroporphyrinogen-III synthase [Deltaproteobacteria bacterium]